LLVDEVLDFGVTAHDFVPYLLVCRLRAKPGLAQDKHSQGGVFERDPGHSSNVPCGLLMVGDR
jgi:hypothetical protein